MSSITLGYPVALTSSADSKPYAPSFVVPASLADLRGPKTGEVVLPNRILWNPSRPFALSDRKRRRSLLRILLREARTTSDLTTYVNRDVLVEHWADLNLPAQIRNVWEKRFPELAEESKARSAAEPR